MFNRIRSVPVWISRSIISWLSVAGPSVTRILVLRMRKVREENRWWSEMQARSLPRRSSLLPDVTHHRASASTHRARDCPCGSHERRLHPRIELCAPNSLRQLVLHVIGGWVEKEQNVRLRI